VTLPESDVGVRGERDATVIAGAPSLQSRVSSVLAVGLMSVLGLGMLTWYYANAMTRQSRAQQAIQATATQHAQTDMPLPGLGRIDPPAPPAPPAVDRPPLPTQEPPALALPLREIPLAPSQSGNAADTPAAPKTPAQLNLERQLSGTVFSSQGTPATVPSGESSTARPPPSESGDLASLLRPSATPAVRAQVLPTQRLLLPKGAFLDCTLETAIDSTLPGMTTCVMATDTFGVDGQVVLLERGTKLVGETRGQVQQGSARVFVLWDEARTPTGVIVPLASPGTDELGRSGLSGTVDRHFWERFGAAILVSVIDGTIQSAVQSSHGNGGTVIVNPSATQDVMTEVLKNTINIPPTVVKHQGDRIQVLVARDLDFRSVYELRSVTHAP
jgi:type IV secretion system protein VirB10